MAEQPRTIRDILHLRRFGSPVDESVILRRIGSPVDPSSLCNGESDRSEKHNENIMKQNVFGRVRRLFNNEGQQRLPNYTRRNIRETLREFVKLVIFYVCFITANVAYFSALVAFYYATLSYLKPCVTGRDTILNSPGLTLRPFNPDGEGAALEVDWLTRGDYDPFEDIRQTLVRMQGPWFDVARDNVTGGCGPCSSLTQFGTLGTVDADGNYTAPKPCVLLKLNRIYGFKPQGSEVNKTRPEDPLCNRTAETETIKVAKLKCEIDGKEEGISYFPQQGFRLDEFPFEESKKSPFVFLQFADLVGKGRKTVTCTMMDEEILVEVGRYPGESLGYVSFTVQFDDTNTTKQLAMDCCDPDWRAPTTPPGSYGITVPQPPQTRVRLSGGTNSSGTVIVNYNNTDYVICDSDWGTEDAHVVCRMLGFQTNNAQPTVKNTFGHQISDLEDIRYGQMACTGKESNLVDCPNSGPGPQCTTGDIAGVRCDPSPRDCKLGFTARGDKCYRRSELTWKYSKYGLKDDCDEFGAHIAAPKNAKENKFVYDIGRRQSQVLQIGALYNQHKKTWQWEHDGNDVTWTNWLPTKYFYGKWYCPTNKPYDQLPLIYRWWLCVANEQAAYDECSLNDGVINCMFNDEPVCVPKIRKGNTVVAYRRVLQICLNVTLVDDPKVGATNPRWKYGRWEWLYRQTDKGPDTVCQYGPGAPEPRKCKDRKQHCRKDETCKPSSKHYADSKYDCFKTCGFCV